MPKHQRPSVRATAKTLNRPHVHRSADTAINRSNSNPSNPKAQAKERWNPRANSLMPTKDSHIIDNPNSRELDNRSARINQAETAASISGPKYLPALDGLRALAVIAVIVYHMGFTIAGGGLMGVTIFFAISGYLITSLLISEYERTGTIKLTSFWMRRGKRLLPAIIFLLIGVAAMCVIFNHALLTKMREDILPSLLFFNNWWQIFHDVSYFQAAGSPSPLAHFWSLGIEEQFYIVWPIIVLFALRKNFNYGVIRWFILALSIISCVEMFILYSPSADPSRVYYGTDTRAFSLLLGTLLAFWWPAFSRKPTHAGSLLQGSMINNAIGITSLSGLIAIIVFTNGYSAFPYRGGILLTTLLSCALIFTLVDDKSITSKFFALKPFVWIGKRSYGMYLWHFPILLLTQINQEGPQPWWLCIIQLALIVGITEFSYRFIENPVRHGQLTTWIKQASQSTIFIKKWCREHIPACVGAIILSAVALFGGIIVPDEITTGEQNQSESVGQEQLTGGALGPNISKTDDSGWGFSTNNEGVPIYDVLLLGDSVSKMTYYSGFYDYFPWGHIDAEVGRSVDDCPYSTYADNNRVAKTVIISLGTNGPLSKDQADTLLSQIDPSINVYWINNRMTNEWQNDNNKIINALPERWDNVTVLDWYGISEGHSEYFDGDGTHLTADAGCTAFLEMIRSALNYPDNPPKLEFKNVEEISGNDIDEKRNNEESEEQPPAI